MSNEQVQPEITAELPGANNLIDLLKTQRAAINNLQRLREFADTLGMDVAEIELIDEMLLRVDQHRFTVAVVGEFKRGKSTFVNALLGEEILPADVLPATATLNRVTYNLRPYVEIHYRADSPGGERGEEIGIHDLPAYVTKLTTESRARAAHIQEAVVHYPNNYLRKNVDIVDTPGLNDDDSMTAVTLQILPKTDAAIMVLMPENPFGGYEGEFLDRLLLSDLGRVMFVVNAIDRIYDPGDQERLLEKIAERIQLSVRRKAEERFGTEPATQDERELHIKRIGKPRVFGLSSLDALDGKLKDDEGMLAQSKFPEFERALDTFLTHERGVIALQSLAARIIASGGKIVLKINQLVGSARMTRREFEDSCEVAEREIVVLRERLQGELRQIESSAEHTRQQIRPILSGMGSAMRQAAEQTIAEVAISPAEIGRKQQPALIERLGHEVSRSTDAVARAVAERAQTIIQKQIAIDLERASHLATAVDRGLHTIDLQFGAAFEQAADKTTLKGQTFSTLTGAGFFVGGSILAMKGLAMAAGGIIVLSLPVALVMFAGIGLVSLLTSGAISRRVFAQDRVEQFRKVYLESALVQIDQQFHAQYPALERQFFDHVDDTFAQLRRSLQREIGGAIVQAQHNLDELRRMRERNETLTEVQIKAYERISAEAQRIVSKAHGLSNTLRDIQEAQS